MDIIARSAGIEFDTVFIIHALFISQEHERILEVKKADKAR